MKELRPYQAKTVNIILENINKNIKSQAICLPTGAGKSYIAATLIQELLKQNKRIFFLVANEPLVKQAYDEFCSIGLNPSIIKSGMDKYYKSYAGIQILMLQTYVSRLEKINIEDPDIIIMDECDYCWKGEMIKKVFNKYSEAFIIGISATIIDDKSFLLPNFDFYYNEITVKYLQKEGFLSLDKHNFRCAKPDLSNVRMKSTGDFNDEDLDEACNQAYLIEDIIRTYKQKDLGYKGICFAISIKHAENLQKAFNNAGISCGIIHSKMKKAHRD